MNLRRLLFLALPLVVVVAAKEAAAAKKMYRWIDEHGNVIVSDQVPPEQQQFKREVLSNKAHVVDVVEQAKTAEQLEQQRRLDALRKEQEKVVAKQASNDKVLLSTFRSLNDINMALQRKMEAFDAKQRIIDGNIKHLETQLQQQQQQAADHERNGRKIPAKLIADIASSKQQIQATQQELANHNAEREKARTEFEADIARFKFLTQGNSDNAQANQDQATGNASGELGLFVCQDADQCEKAWNLAAQFVAKHSTTDKDIITDKLIMHLAPKKDDDISLSVSKMTQSNGLSQIFLDIRCRTSTLGNELCGSSKVQDIRKAFVPYIGTAL